MTDCVVLCGVINEVVINSTLCFDQSTTVHEASLAVAQLSGTEAFFKYSTQLFECAEVRK